jgi:hypothetical protein
MADSWPFQAARAGFPASVNSPRSWMGKKILKNNKKIEMFRSLKGYGFCRAGRFVYLKFPRR